MNLKRNKTKTFKKEINLIYDIFPPEKIEKIARDISGIKEYKTKTRKILAFSWRTGLAAFLIIYLITGLGPVRFIKESIRALTQETKVVNFYSQRCEGDWQNPEKVQGEPEVGPEGDLNYFSELNSAIYQNGPHDLICRDFIAKEQEGNQKITESPRENVPESFVPEEEIINEEEGTASEEAPDEEQGTAKEEIIEEATTGEEIISQIQEENGGQPQETSSLEVNTSNREEIPISFLDKVKKSFSDFKVFADEKNESFKSAKIKISLAIGEKEPDNFKIEETKNEDHPLELEIEGEFQEINNSGTKDSVGFWEKIKTFFIEQKANAQEPGNNNVEIETSSQPDFLEDFLIGENASTESSAFLLEEMILGEATNSGPETDFQEEIPEEITATEEIFPESNQPSLINDEIIPGLDTKIIIWYSLDGEMWWRLDVISDYPLSNAINGGYFEYDASFLKNWDDVKNLKIKIEGSVGGESNVMAYLDSVWVEAEYQEKEAEESYELKPLKKDFRADETPEFEVMPKGHDFDSGILEKLTAKIIEPFQEEPGIEAILKGPGKEEKMLSRGKDFYDETHSPTRIIILNRDDFSPGLHKLKVNYEKDGKTHELETEFTWGVLAINANKSIFLPDEQSYLQMAALDSSGNTLCNANLSLEIISPSGLVQNLKVEKSGECFGNNVTNVPDYFAYYQTAETGVYKMKLANLNNGYEISDSFEVREEVPFEVERIGPTRIYPFVPYQMIMRIKANQDFSGKIIETVPAGFDILNPETCNLEPETQEKNISCFMLQASRNEQQLVWPVDWKAGEIHELKYIFDAPDKSPYLYLLGFLNFQEKTIIDGIIDLLNPSASGGTSVFREARFWQIASDAPNWLDGWEYRKELTIDSSKIDEDLINFPILVSLSTSTFDFSKASSTGADIRFTSDDGETLLNYERERHDSVNELAEYWVKTSASSTASTTLYIYYGNSSASDGENATSVWDSNYVSVWHKDDGASQAILDSTSNGHDGTKKSANNPLEADGKIGKGQDYSNDDISFGDLAIGNAYTAEAWIKADALGGAGDLGTYGNTIMASARSGSGYPLWITVGKGNGTEVTLRAFTTSVTGSNTTGANLNTTDWFHIVAIATKNSTAKVYVNGIEKLSLPTVGNTNWTTEFFTGDLRRNRAIYFDGLIDEVRISNAVRSAAWIKATYNSGNNSLINFGIEEDEGLPYPPTLYPEDGTNQISFNNIRQSSTTPTFRVSSIVIAGEFDRFQLELNTTSDFTGTSYTQTFSGTYTSDTEYNLLANNLSPSLPTTNGATYYVRVRASSNSGSSWGLWSTENHAIWTFTYKSADEPADWFQTTTEQFETGTLDGAKVTNGSVHLAGAIEATGGATSTHNGYIIHTFTSSGTFEITDGMSEVEYLVVAGGGGTGPRIQGGGGGGGVVQGTTTLGAGTYSITVGAGGAAAPTTDQTDMGSNGSNSVFDSIATAVGGGRGGAMNNANGASGGSGGGARGNTSGAVGGSGTSGQGNKGGDGASGVGGAGGGGAGEQGQDGDGQAPSYTAGDGGDGIASDISGTSTYYGGGGAGGGGDGLGRAYGGLGGGGDGGQTSGEDGDDGAPNTGGGGGGGGFTGSSNAYGGSGGSGIVIVRYDSSATGNTIMSPEIDFDLVPGQDSWGEVDFSTDETNGDIKLSLYYSSTTTCDTIIPDLDLEGNEDGFDVTDTIDISELSTTTYSSICLQATLTDIDGTPYLNDWTVTWEPPVTTITISGTSDVATGTVAIAVDDSLQSATGSISSGTWSISDVSVASGSIVTVWIDGKDEADESTCIGKYDGEGDMTGLVLNRHVLSIKGISNDRLYISDFNQYNNDDDEDIMYNTSSLALNVDADNSYSDEKINILANTWLQFNDGETLNTHDLEINGRLTAVQAPVFNISGSWENNGNFDSSSETINFTSTGNETIDSTVSIEDTLNYQLHNVVFNGLGGQWTILSYLDVDDIVMTEGSLIGNYDVIVNEGGITGTNGIINLTGGITTISGTGNLGPTGNGTFDFYNLTFSGTTTGAGNFDVASILTISDSQSFNASGTTVNLTGSGTPFVIDGTFTSASSTIKYTATSSTNIAATTYYNLELAPSDSGSPTFTLAGGTITANGYLYIGDGINPVTVTANANDPNLDINGDFNIKNNAVFTGSDSANFYIVGNWIDSGTFNHSNGTTTFDASTNKTISATSSAFYDLVFNGAGSWAFQGNTATASNDFIIISGSVTSTDGTLGVGGSWSNSGTFSNNNGKVLFFSASGGETISDGGSAFYNVEFNGSGGEWLYADGTNGINQTEVKAGTPTYLNTKTGIVSVTGGTLNVDWYLGAHLVDVNSTSTNIDTEESDIAISTDSAWHDPSWSYRKKITIDHTKVDDDLTDFPVLVSTTSADLSSKAQYDGDDILFTQSDGTSKIPHEIELYASSTGELVAWVKTDLSSSTDTYLYMYYGNPGASNQQQATSVWSNNYAGIWHLGETTGSYLDSTLNNNEGVLTDNDLDSIRGVSGKIGKGIDFNGDADYITVPDNTTLDLNAFTIEAWVKFDIVTGYLTQKTRAGTGYEIFDSNWSLETRTANRIRAGSGNCSGGFGTPDGPTTVTTDTWYYFVYSFGGSGSYQRLYYNGTNTGSNYRENLTTCKGDNDIIRIGARGGSVGSYVNGIMDGVKISTVQRSNTWISTSYNTMNSPSTFMGFGGEESSSSVSTVWRHDGSSWGTASSSQTTGSGSEGKNPQPNSDGAIRIREYSKTSSDTNYYKYNLQVSTAGFSNYDYYSDYGGNYITSVSSTESGGVDKCIGEDWQRNTIGEMNGSQPYDGLNEKPDYGSWYIGLSSDLVFSISSVSASLDLLSPNFTASASTTLYATTSYSGGYTIRAYASYNGRLRLDDSNYISRWDYSNSSPALWFSTCVASSECGFGYTTDDSNLGGGTGDRFATSTKYAGFATSSPGDPVADSDEAVQGDAHIITYKTSVLSTQTAGVYYTTIYYICTANY